MQYNMTYKDDASRIMHHNAAVEIRYWFGE